MVDIGVKEENHRLKQTGLKKTDYRYFVFQNKCNFFFFSSLGEFLAVKHGSTQTFTSSDFLFPHLTIPLHFTCFHKSTTNYILIYLMTLISSILLAS